MLAWPSRNSCHLGKTSGVPDSVLAALRLARSLLPTPRGGKQSVVQHHFTDEKSGTESVGDLSKVSSLVRSTART